MCRWEVFGNLGGQILETHIKKPDGCGLRVENEEVKAMNKIAVRKLDCKNKGRPKTKAEEGAVKLGKVLK